MATRPVIDVNLSAICKNWCRIADTCGANVKCGAVVKANAYGMGMGSVARALKTVGADRFFVANCKEGDELRRSVGGDVQIFVLAGYSSDLFGNFAQSDLVPCISDIVSLKQFLSDFPKKDYALHVETGLNRLALDDGSAASLLSRSRAHEPSLIMSHLACADDINAIINDQQLKRLKNSALVQLYPDVDLSISGTDGVFLGQRFQLDLVRPGIGLYCGGFGQITSDCLRVSAGVISIKEIEAGECVGYGQTWKASQNTRIAALSMGYADGLPRTTNEFHFFADGVPCAVRGRVSMDIVNVDVTHLSNVPDRFELVGEHQSLSQLSERFCEIPNTTLTRFGACMESRLL